MATHLHLSKLGQDIEAADFFKTGRHIIMAGASGSGKTAAAKVVLDHDLAEGRLIVIFDPDDVYGDYAVTVDTLDQLQVYCLETPKLKGIRFVTEDTVIMTEMLTFLWEWTNQHHTDATYPGLTVVADELPIFLDTEPRALKPLLKIIDKIANRGRFRNLWGLWLARDVGALPYCVIHTARLALIGQHKKSRALKDQFKLADKQALLINNARLAEFLVWAPGINPFVTTLRPPERGDYPPVVNVPFDADNGPEGLSASDIYAELCDVPAEVYQRVFENKEAFDLLAALTGANDSLLAGAMQFVDTQIARPARDG